MGIPSLAIMGLADLFSGRDSEDKTHVATPSIVKCLIIIYMIIVPVNDPERSAPPVKRQRSPHAAELVVRRNGNSHSRRHRGC